MDSLGESVPGNPDAVERLCIAGLGNPGKKYEDTRHNIGFIMVQRLAERYGFADFRKGRLCTYTEGNAGGKELFLCMPQTYMNRSGEALRLLLESEELNPSQCLVVYDDFALPAGTLRMRKKGSAGGHNGLQSVIDELGTAQFPRLRLGIGSPDDGGDITDYVLGRFGDDEWNLAVRTVETACSAVTHLLVHGFSRTMSVFNSQQMNFEDKQ
ncbi:MAG: aminoacyl-tRNA hydrolase [Ectothiorhodospiraceae bacterium]|nr:aminoacyl-tRNA hydrolase [Ectothiorhodospiraceae bacterium]